MKMIIYELRDDKFYIDGKQVSKQQVLTCLKSYQLKKLYEFGKCRVKIKCEKQGEQREIYRDLTSTAEVNSSIKLSKGYKERKILEKIRDQYKIESHTYPTLGLKHELWRKNKRYGYYNCVCYLDDLQQLTIDNAILADYEQLKQKRESS